MEHLKPKVLQQRSPRLSRREAALVRRHGINYPLFIPETGRRLEQYLMRGAASEFIAAVAQLATAGSEQAASLRLYLEVVWGCHTDVEGAQAAREKCLAAAQRGDAYAMYVISLVRRAEGDNADAMNWMRKAATRHGFLPAFVELARYAASGIGFRAPDLSAAYTLMRSSHRLGHRCALGFMAVSLIRGARGWWGRPIGILLWLPAMIRSYLFWMRYPLDERIFK
jgi:hypothetical protein